MLRRRQRRTHGEDSFSSMNNGFVWVVYLNEDFLTCVLFCFAARHPLHGSRPPTDSVSSADLHHHHLSGGADPWRLSKHRQLLQVICMRLMFVHFTIFGGGGALVDGLYLFEMSLHGCFLASLPGFSTPSPSLDLSTSRLRSLSSHGHTRSESLSHERTHAHMHTCIRSSCQIPY